MEKVQLALLQGLKKFGRTKTFAEILDEAEIHNDNAERLEAAYALEASGLIQAVSYQLPLSIRAELSPAGRAYLESLKRGGNGAGSGSALPKILAALGLF